MNFACIMNGDTPLSVHAVDASQTKKVKLIGIHGLEFSKSTGKKLSTKSLSNSGRSIYRPVSLDPKNNETILYSDIATHIVPFDESLFEKKQFKKLLDNDAVSENREIGLDDLIKILNDVKSTLPECAENVQINTNEYFEIEVTYTSVESCRDYTIRAIRKPLLDELRVNAKIEKRN